jgi:hypothetical protein
MPEVENDWVDQRHVGLRRRDEGKRNSWRIGLFPPQARPERFGGTGNPLPLITAQPYRIFGPEGQHGITGHANTAAAGLDHALVGTDCPYSILMGTNAACVHGVADSGNRVAHALDRDRLHTQRQVPNPYRGLGSGPTGSGASI